MTIDDFWKLMAHVDRKLLQRGERYDEAAIGPLIAALTVLSKAELQSFQDHLAQALYDIDGRLYADAAGSAGDSDDSFLYVRCFVVAMGRDVYQRTVHDPGLMRSTDERSCELLLYAARTAWQKQTGEEADFDTIVSFESGSNAALWPPQARPSSDAEYLRRQARELRATADKIKNDPVTKRDMLQGAENYERMAEQAEKKAGS
jgi:Protein of unknown function (DUF4240)